MKAERVSVAWTEFQRHAGGLVRPTTEEEYERIVDLMRHVSDTYGTKSEPYAALFDYLAGLAHTWELENESALKDPDIEPYKVLAYLMEERGVSQYQLAREGLVNHGNLSRILSGERGISKALARKLAERFYMGVGVFICRGGPEP